MISFISAVEVDMKTEFQQGETLLAKISGNFIDPILPSNVFFYRGHVRVPMDYSILKINKEFYIYAYLPETSNNYSLSIENVRYYSGSKIIDDNIVKDFSISSEKADFSVKPGIIFTSNNFEVSVQNLKDNKITLNIDSNFDSIDSAELLSGEIKKITFGLGGVSSQSLEFIDLSSGNLAYSLPVYFFGENLFCGDEICSENENCSSCYEDCGECSDEPFCGDNICDENEDCSSCYEDCGECTEEFFCGDKICNNNENCTTCEEDCGKCKLEIDFEFDPSELNISILTNSKKTKKIILKNTGTFNLEDLEIYVSNSFKDYISVFPEKIDSLEGGESKEIELEIISSEDEASLIGAIKAKTPDKEYAYLDLYLNFVSDESEVGEEIIKSKKTCAELSGKICSSDEKCSGELIEARDAKCCLGSCNQETATNFKVWGWGILILIILVGIWFLTQYKKTENKPSLFKK